MLKNKQLTSDLTEMHIKTSKIKKELLQEKEINSNLLEEIEFLNAKVNSNTRSSNTNLTQSNDTEEFER